MMGSVGLVVSIRMVKEEVFRTKVDWTMPEASEARATRVYLWSPVTRPTRLPPALKDQEAVGMDSEVTGIKLGVLMETKKLKSESLIQSPEAWSRMAMDTELMGTLPVMPPEMVGRVVTVSYTHLTLPTNREV